MNNGKRKKNNSRWICLVKSRLKPMNGPVRVDYEEVTVIRKIQMGTYKEVLISLNNNYQWVTTLNLFTEKPILN